MPHDCVEIKLLEKDLIPEASLGVRVDVVLLTNSVNVSPLEPTQRGNKAPGAMLPFVAVDEDGVVGAVENNVESTVDVAALNSNSALVGIDVHLEVLDAGPFHEVAVLGRDVLGDEGDDGFEFQAFQEVKVLLLRVAAPVDGAWNYGTIIVRWKQGTQASRGNGLGNGRWGSGFGCVANVLVRLKVLVVGARSVLCQQLVMVQAEAGEAGLNTGEQAAPGSGLFDAGGRHGLEQEAGGWRCGSEGGDGVVQPRRAGWT